MFQTPRTAYPLIAACLLVLGVVIARSAWMCDDAYIGFRVADNWVHGLGLTWNAGERVQVFTNPLWIILVSALYAATREMYFTVLALSIALSVLAVGLIAFRTARTTASAVVVIAVALSSKAFVDYAASGLENPLSYLVLAAFYATLLGDPSSPWRVFRLSLLTSLAALNRLDTLVLTLPAWLAVGRDAVTRKGVREVLLGMLPLVAWEAFSFLYYGSFVPNTAFAKLNTGIGRLAFIGRGLHYLSNSLVQDPVTPAFIAIATAGALSVGDRRLRAIALGIAANLAYVVWIGGDFMSGRFLTAPLVAALVLLGEMRPSRSLVGVMLAGLAALNLVAPHAPVFSDASYGMRNRGRIMDRLGVSDERACYYPWTGLLNARPDMAEPFHAWAEYGRQLRAQGKMVVVAENLGFTGFFAGPEVYIINWHALSDPFLARLPAPRGEVWRVGHQRRPIPEGYVETKATGENHLADPLLARRYDRIQYVISGPLWDADRLRASARLAMGELD
jgi:arabinofuranosyltransferase